MNRSEALAGTTRLENLGNVMPCKTSQTPEPLWHVILLRPCSEETDPQGQKVRLGVVRGWRLGRLLRGEAAGGVQGAVLGGDENILKLIVVRVTPRLSVSGV